MSTILTGFRKLPMHLGNFFILMMLALLAACGGSSDQVVKPNNLTYSLNPAIYTNGVAIAANSASSSGDAVVSYSVSPPLPAGLSLNTSNGSITGTPTAATALAVYTVTATNTGGSTTAGLSITVQDAKPSNLTYSLNPAIYTNGVAIATNSASSSGGAVVSYSVSPTLPAGLSLNTSNGSITGTPTAATAVAVYTVTATNTGGSTTVGLSITVNTPTASPVTLNTSTAVMDPGVQRIFSASVVGLPSSAVTWSTFPEATGTLVPMGDSSVTYTAPSTAGTVQLTATSVSDNNAQATVTITVRATAATVEDIFNNWNLGGVTEPPTTATTFTITASRRITYFDTYHWNHGGVLPGLLSLRHSDGTVYGPWQATGIPGMGGNTNAIWVCYPDIDIKAGTYTVVDSDPATWSQDGESGGQGFAHLQALPLP